MHERVRTLMPGTCMLRACTAGAADTMVQRLQFSIGIPEDCSMEFTEKSVDEVGEWLKLEKFSEDTVRIFGMYTTSVTARYAYIRRVPVVQKQNRLACVLNFNSSVSCLLVTWYTAF